MSNPLEIDVVTIFPHMLDSILNESMLKRAQGFGAVRFRMVDLRDFCDDAHRTTDDRPYGGGPGMVMKPEPLFRAVEHLRSADSRVILMSPQGASFKQSMAQRLSREQHLIFLCGHYEGVDERVRQHLIDEEISIGDYILTNGVLATGVVIDALTRLRPNVLGDADSMREESFSKNRLEYPHYTRPAEFRGMRVPDILCSGDHASIAKWRASQSEERTYQRRPDLLKKKDNLD